MQLGVLQCMVKTEISICGRSFETRYLILYNLRLEYSSMKRLNALVVVVVVVVVVVATEVVAVVVVIVVVVVVGGGISGTFQFIKECFLLLSRKRLPFIP